MAIYRTTTSEIPAYIEVISTPVAMPFHVRLGVLSGLMLKASLVVTALFAITLSLTHAQAYNNRELQALITPPIACAMPCWNGIQAGVSTVHEAAALLANDPTVSDYRVSEGKISWWWNGDQSALLDATGRAFHGRMETAIVNGEETVTSVVLDTTVLMGDVRLTLGDPDSITLYTVPPQEAAQSAGIVYVANYDDVSVFTTLQCPMNVADFWQSPSYIAFGTPTLAFQGETFEFDSLPGWFFRDAAPGCMAS